MRFLLVPCASILLAAAMAHGQGGGFFAGDLYEYDGNLFGYEYTFGGILQLDPIGGTSTLYAQPRFMFDGFGSIAFDSYRQRLVWCASEGELLPPELHFTDAAGNTSEVLGSGVWHGLSPTGDGRIYVVEPTGSTAPIRWLDGANVVRILHKADGVTPWTLDNDPAAEINSMSFDAGTNALFIASRKPCLGSPFAHIFVRKVPLSADGSRVVASVVCVDHLVPFLFPAVMRGLAWSRLPDGRLLLVTDMGDILPTPDMLAVDPVTVSVTDWASNDAFVFSSGTWSGALGSAVLLDTIDNVLRSFAAGTTGGLGTPITLTGVPISNNSCCEPMTLVEIPASACAGGWMAHGQGLPGAGGLVPELVGSGCPSPGGACTLRFSSAVGGAHGALLVGFAGANVPFKGGSLYLFPIALQIALALGGTAGVPGAGQLSLPIHLPDGAALSGLSLFLQAAFSDAAAVHKVSLSQGLELTLG